MGNYDHIVSLGYNCEVSFRIQDYLKRPIDSYPFSWCYVLDQNQMGNILQMAVDGKLTQGDYLLRTNEMINFHDSNCAFHLRHDEVPLFDAEGVLNESMVPGKLAELHERMSHLQKKFNSLLEGNDRVLYVLKVQDSSAAGKNSDERIERNIKDIRDFLLSRSANRSFTLLAVMREERLSERLIQLDDKNIVMEGIAEYAPDSEAKQGRCVDDWIMMLEYYDCAAEDENCCRKERLRSGRMEEIRRRYVKNLRETNEQNAIRINEINQENQVLKKTVEKLRKELGRKDEELFRVYNSKSWYIGRVITHIPRRMEKYVRKKQKDTGTENDGN